MAKRSRFVIEVSVDGVAKFGADTPISLKSSARQASFREIKDQRLKRILTNKNPLVLVATKMILGVGHLANKEFGRDNLHISSQFLASLLDNGESKAEAKLLLVKMFRKDLVGGLDEVLSFVVEGRGVPRPSDFAIVRGSDEAVKLFPFLLDLSGPALSKHRMVAAVAIEFLKKFFGLMAAGGVKWVEVFEEFAALNNFL